MRFDPLSSFLCPSRMIKNTNMYSNERSGKIKLGTSGLEAERDWSKAESVPHLGTPHDVVVTVPIGRFMASHRATGGGGARAPGTGPIASTATGQR